MIRDYYEPGFPWPAFQVIQGDITTADTRAIVNSANRDLQAGGGVCGAIFEAAGYDELQYACNEIGYCETGESVITPGFNLTSEWIIHTVGPIYHEYVPEDAERLLRSAYRSAMNLAKERKIRSVSFPLISAGVYGYPLEEAIAIALKEIKVFLSSGNYIAFAQLYCYSAESYQVAMEMNKRG